MKGSDLCGRFSCLGERCCSLIAGTDINGALLAAVGVLDKAEQLPERSVSMIILLTDGQPTSGEWVLRSALPPLRFFLSFTLASQYFRPSLCFRRALEYAGWAAAGAGEGDYERALLREWWQSLPACNCSSFSWELFCCIPLASQFINSWELEILQAHLKQKNKMPRDKIWAFCRYCLQSYLRDIACASSPSVPQTWDIFKVLLVFFAMS